MLQTGQKFPDFALPNQDNKTLKLGDFAGRWLIIYIYPKDDTPGCTIEGKGFSATKNEFEKLNAYVLGLSQDDVSSHKSFCNKFGFTMSLIADPQAQLLKATGIGQTEYKGMLYWNRTTFLIDPKGIVRKVYQNVNPQDHEKAVLEDIRALQKSAH